tara:strand:- start:1972 stop:3039 length:1068 start_codon:yes stop_codon:yes gene_type:complete
MSEDTQENSVPEEAKLKQELEEVIPVEEQKKIIDKLAPAQEAEIPAYVDKWTNRGINTDRLDPERTKKIANDYQRLILERKETPVAILDNPLEAWVACNLIEQGKASVDDIPDLIKQSKAYFDQSIEDQKAGVADAVWPHQDGSYFSSVFSFYDFMINVVGVEFKPELLEKYHAWEETSHLGLIYPLDEICIVSQKASAIRLNEEGQLHCDGDYALKYEGRGNFEVYALYGVSVSKELAVTPARDLDFDTNFLQEQNADVKAVFLRKVGVEALLEKGSKIDTYEKYSIDWWDKSEYELWDMESLFTSHDYAPHLRMKNQTTGVWHVEAVSKDCKNIEEALKERFGEDTYELMAIA